MLCCVVVSSRLSCSCCVVWCPDQSCCVVAVQGGCGGVGWRWCDVQGGGVVKGEVMGWKVNVEKFGIPHLAIHVSQFWRSPKSTVC